MSSYTTLTGNLTRDPEIRYTKDGLASAVFGVAVNRRWQNPTSHDWEETVSFIDVVCWRELAENAAMSLSKGMRVTVSGRLEQRTWENESGERRSRVEVVATDVGASLRYATADVHRHTRAGDGGADDELPSEAPLDPAPVSV